MTLQTQIEEHLNALDNDDLSPAEKAVVYRNLSRHLKKWQKTLEEEAKSLEVRAFVAAQRKSPKLQAA